MPTFPLSGGKLKTVTANFFSAFFFWQSLQMQKHFKQLLNLRSLIFLSQRLGQQTPYIEYKLPLDEARISRMLSSGTSLTSVSSLEHNV